MTKQYYFISGLPRSGSTLLSAILRQNPKVYADISSPVHGVIANIIDGLTYSENTFNVDENTRKSLVKSIFDSYYQKFNQTIIFDSSRAWTSKTSLLNTLFPYTKIICCVRDIKYILDSFERIISKNVFYTNTLIEPEYSKCTNTRCKSLMDPSLSGQVIKPWYWLQDALSLNPDMIYLVEYEELCKNPKQTLKNIYNFINKPFFDHDFENVSYKNEIFDLALSVKDLHTVNKKVEWVEKKPILPEYVLEQYNNMEFWRKNKEKIQYE